MLIVQSLLRMRLSLISSYLFCSWMRFPRPDFHGLLSLIRTTHYRRVWSWNFFRYHQLPPLSMGRPEKCDFFWTFANELVPRVMVLLVGNHVDLPNREICHVSPIHSLCCFRCQGPLLINSWFPALPSSFLKFPSSSTLVLDPHLEVSCVHSFPRPRFRYIPIFVLSFLLRFP